MKSPSLPVLAEVSRSRFSDPLQRVNCPGAGVKIWTAHLDSITSDELGELSALLDTTEQNRAARFHFERDRRHYICARGLLRRLLGATLDQPAADIDFEYGPHGKPALAPTRRCDPGLRFNLSHSAGWTMFAFAWDRDLGIDLEGSAHLANKGRDLSDLAARILSPRELNIWRALKNIEARRAALLRAWVRKEAFVKATGDGLSDGFAKLEFILDAAAPGRSLTIPQQTGGRGRRWTLHDLTAPEGFAAALAVEQR
jgi:4'-phosphopantetheinyl transferase